MSRHVIVLGGGVVGVCAAYYLARAGAAVTLLERADIAAGSSHGNAGLIVPSHAVPLAAPGVLWQLSLTAAALDDRPRRSRLAGAVRQLPVSVRSTYNDAVVDDSRTAMAARLRTAFDLCALGESMRRAQLRREHPGATDDEVEAMLIAWLETRPGAEHGDAWGRPTPWPPSRR